ncbi:hypothetical protein [Bacillus sp. EB600]|uniref:hypothetical protein n=1 Tax=Bacillus sp. EB600 TaxID=2806345 RepID=UPI00210EC4C8|nr:hypothetical protein [Bacillus sp. EB600]MCQ6279083.1 hypothetical protein [Bacillus sp. EB600]
MLFSYSSDYIKYLNDPDCNGMNYDQWKDKKMRQELKKNSNKKKPFHGYSKYNY